MIVKNYNLLRKQETELPPIHINSKSDEEWDISIASKHLPTTLIKKGRR